MRALARILAVLALLLVPRPALAWDEVTHGHITERAMEQVRDPQLKAFLHAHRDAVLSGSWFPDWGHAIKPHGEAVHAQYLDYAQADLARPDVRAQPDYPDRLAHQFGVYAHVVEDRWLDATLKKHAHEIGEPRRDDMENGLILIAGQGWLKRDFKPYVPKAELARIYAQANYFGDARLNAATLDPVMTRSMDGIAALEQQYKLLSFLTADYIRWKFPWGAANLETAPGGLESNARAVAAGWEALWAAERGRPAPFFVATLPAQGGTLPSADPHSPYGRITIATRTRFDTRRLTSADITLVDAAGQATPVRVWPYIDEPGHDIDLAFQIETLRPLAPGGAYHLTIRPGAYVPAKAGAAAPLDLDFQVPQGAVADAGRPPQPRPWVLGVFLFVLLGGLGGLLFGLADVLRLVFAAKAPRDPWWIWLVAVPTKAAGLSLFTLGLWLLATDGAVAIEYLRLHH